MFPLQIPAREYRVRSERKYSMRLIKAKQRAFLGRAAQDWDCRSLSVLSNFTAVKLALTPRPARGRRFGSLSQYGLRRWEGDEQTDFGGGRSRGQSADLARSPHERGL